MLTLLIRTFIIYFVLIFSIRIMGKRQIGEIQISEFIITLMLSEIATAPITSSATPLSHAIAAILLLLTLELLVSFLLIKCNPLKRLFYGRPSLLIRRGKLMQDEIRKNRVEVEELLAELRQQGYSDLSDVYYVILEANGKLSVFPRAAQTPVTPENLNLTVPEHGIAHVCIIDGDILEHSLTSFGWDAARVLHELKRRKTALSDVFLMTVDDLGTVNIVPKQEKKRR